MVSNIKDYASGSALPRVSRLCKVIGSSDELPMYSKEAPEWNSRTANARQWNAAKSSLRLTLLGVAAALLCRSRTLRPDILPSRSSLSEDMEALTSIVPETTEPYQTTIVGNKVSSLPFHKAGISKDANKISRNLTPAAMFADDSYIHFRRRADAQPHKHLAPKVTKSACDSSPEATNWTTSESPAALFMPNHELGRI
ncbi:hypothetical protein MRX96_047135 [Rhipicephalus microplus]